MTTGVALRRASHADIGSWSVLRAALWPDQDAAGHAEELRASGDGWPMGFLAFADDGDAIAFAEVGLRHDYVNGTESSPVAFLEGWYVAPAWRGHGVGRVLVAAAEVWAREQGCSEFASDAPLDNTGSHAAHRACGFEEAERVVYFRKRLGG